MKSLGMAWSVMADAETPERVPFPVLAYSLSFVGYILLPIAIAVTFAGLVDRATTQRQQTPRQSRRSAHDRYFSKRQGAVEATTGVIDEASAAAVAPDNPFPPLPGAATEAPPPPEIGGGG
jgi:hypothetical protein